MRLNINDTRTQQFTLTGDVRGVVDVDLAANDRRLLITIRFPAGVHMEPARFAFVGTSTLTRHYRQGVWPTPACSDIHYVDGRGVHPLYRTRARVALAIWTQVQPWVDDCTAHLFADAALHSAREKVTLFERNAMHYQKSVTEAILALALAREELQVLEDATRDV